MLSWSSESLGVKGDAFVDAVLGADGLRFKIGAHCFDFLTPRDAVSPLISWLRQFGPSPYAVVLKSAGGAAQTLDVGLTHGARLLVR